MANIQHREILEKGVNYWNEWRNKNRNIIPDLSKSNLFRKRLTGINFSNTNLSNSDLTGCILSLSDLSESNLDSCKLLGAIVSGVNLSNSNLRNANLVEANFNQSNLTGTNLTNTVLYETNFANTNLSFAKGLLKIRHLRSSTIDHRTINKSKDLPKEFLRGCGVPEFLIRNLKELKGDINNYHSCFISYSSKDEKFVNKLYNDLQENGVRCWFAPEDMKIGARIRHAIDQAIIEHDKLLLILSETSINSLWVDQEVERALQREREENTIILFPIRIDNSIFKKEIGWENYLTNSRNIGNFSNWKDINQYTNSYQRLLIGLDKNEDGV